MKIMRGITKNGVFLGLKIEKPLSKRVKRAAKTRKESVSEFVRIALTGYLDAAERGGGNELDGNQGH
jgi:hypothetical protein